jgi:hypothetical protein
MLLAHHHCRFLLGHLCCNYCLVFLHITIDNYYYVAVVSDGDCHDESSLEQKVVTRRSRKAESQSCISFIEHFNKKEG